MNIPPFGFPVPGLPGSPAPGPGGFSLPPPPFGIPPPFARPPMPGFPGFPAVPPFGQPGMPMPGMPGGMPGFPMVSIREIDKMNAKLAVAGLTNKVTNVWVGKISPVVEDETVRKLLEACGSVANWARVEKDGQLKSFGFCKFSNAEGALRSLRLLNGLRLADDCLQLKVDQKTQTELDDYEKRKKEFMAKEEEEKKQTGSLVPIPFSDADEQDEIARDVIKKVTEGVLRALNDEGDGEGVVSREIRSFREKQARLARESKERELEMERRRKEREEEEIRKERRQRERDEREFRDREEDWIEHEKERIREKKRIDDEIRDMRVSRREILEIDDQDEKKNRRNIRSDRKRRVREIENDKRETKREREEEEAKRRERERREQEEERKRQVLEEARLEAQRAALFEADRLKQQLSESRQKRKRDNASIGQFKEEVISSSQQSANGFSVSLNMGTSSTTPKRSTNPAVVPSVQIFKSEPEEEPMLVPNKKRKLVKLEEGSQPVASYSERAKIQAVIDSIPTEKDEIFQFEINWTKIDEGDIVEGKMKPWVTKKIVDFLGEEEETLIEFICKKLVEHTPPDQITALLAYVLEEEATDFVIRLWRMLIYNMLMLE